MKHFYIFLLSLFIGTNFAFSQNTSSYTSPPGVRFNEQQAKLNSEQPEQAADTSGKLRVLNGSFEKNKGICIINGPNSQINNYIKYIYAFGCGNEIDLLTYECGFETAISGNYFLCLANGKQTCGDACTLELSTNLIPGHTYSLSYFDRGFQVGDCCGPAVPLEIGISTAKDMLGTKVYTSPKPATDNWHQRLFTFVAPNDGKYISFHAKDNSGRWTHIDSVVISTAACMGPRNLTVNDVQATSATLSWKIPLSPANFLKIFYKEKGASTGWFERENKKDTITTLTGLSPNTTYEWKIRTFCDTNNSTIIYGDDFTTLPSDGVSNIQLSPNPAKTVLKINGLSTTEQTKLSVYDFLGNVLIAVSTTNKLYSLDIEKLKTGNYLLKIETPGKIISRWFMKQ